MVLYISATFDVPLIFSIVSRLQSQFPNLMRTSAPVTRLITKLRYLISIKGTFLFTRVFTRSICRESNFPSATNAILSYHRKRLRDGIAQNWSLNETLERYFEQQKFRADTRYYRRIYSVEFRCLIIEISQL